MQTPEKKKVTCGQVRALIQKGGRKKCWFCTRRMSIEQFAEHECEERRLFFLEKRLREERADERHRAAAEEEQRRRRQQRLRGPASNDYNAVVRVILHQQIHSENTSR